MDVVDLYCGCGGMSAGAIQSGCRVVAGVDCDDVVLRLWAGNTGGKACVATLWRDPVTLPPPRPNLHVALSPPCTSLSNAQRSATAEAKEEGLDAIRQSIDWVLKHCAIRWRSAWGCSAGRARRGAGGRTPPASGRGSCHRTHCTVQCTSAAPACVVPRRGNRFGPTKVVKRACQKGAAARRSTSAAVSGASRHPFVISHRMLLRHGSKQLSNGSKGLVDAGYVHVQIVEWRLTSTGRCVAPRLEHDTPVARWRPPKHAQDDAIALGTRSTHIDQRAIISQPCPRVEQAQVDQAVHTANPARLAAPGDRVDGPIDARHGRPSQ
jgi:hypothetical protein